jgi:hypothetical protein
MLGVIRGCGIYYGELMEQCVMEKISKGANN